MDDIYVWLTQGVMVAVITGFNGWYIWRSRQARQERDPDACVACGEAEVTWLVPGVYECPSCGHEGGEGRAAFELDVRREVMQGWPPERRRAHAHARWTEALVAIDGALSQLGSVGLGTALMEIVDSGSDGDESDRVYLKAAASAQEAASALHDVAVHYPELPPLRLPFVDARPGDFGAKTMTMIGDRVHMDHADLYGIGDIREAAAMLQQQRDALVAWGRRAGLPMQAVDA